MLAFLLYGDGAWSCIPKHIDCCVWEQGAEECI
jgi:hypothetical protein